MVRCVTNAGLTPSASGTGKTTPTHISSGVTNILSAPSAGPPMILARIYLVIMHGRYIIGVEVELSPLMAP